MLKTCKCGKEFLTEADIHVIIPAKDYETNCGCYFTKEITKLRKELQKEREKSCRTAVLVDKALKIYQEKRKKLNY